MVSSDDQKPPFHDALRALRVSRGWDVRDVSNRSLINQADIREMEAGRLTPEPGQFSRLRKLCFRELGQYRQFLATHWRKGGPVLPPTQAEIDAAVSEASADAQSLAVADVGAELPTLPDPRNCVSFGGALRTVRMNEGLTQAELGEIVGVGGSTVGWWERDETCPIREHHAKLLDLLGVLAECVPPTGQLPRDIAKPGRKVDAAVVVRIEPAATPAPAPGMPPLAAAALAYGERMRESWAAEQELERATAALSAAQQAREIAEQRAVEAHERLAELARGG